MELRRALERASEAAPEELRSRWLAVGLAAARALRDAWPERPPEVERVRDVHEALERMARGGYGACLVDARRIRHRRERALFALAGRLTPERVVVLEDGVPGPALPAPSPSAAPPPPRQHGRPLPAPAPPEPSPAPIPRADGGPAPGVRWAAGRFARCCLERIGDPAGLLAFVRDALHEATAAERISLMLLDPDRRLLRIRAARGMDKALQGAVYCPVGRGLAGRAFALGRALAGRARTPVAGRYRAEAYAILPLGDGTRAVGVANLTSFREDELPDVPTLERWALLARLAGEALALALRLERAEALTQTDALTGLPNRRAFEQALSRDVDRAARSGVQLAVALFDLDHFKRVNDELGHLVGDQALRHAARELSTVLRGSDILARWGGEEFAALLPGLSGGGEAALAAVDRARARRPNAR